MGDKPRIRMLTKLIYVSDFRNTLRKKTANYAHGSPQREMLYAVMDWLDKEPIADAEPVRHARWKYFHKQNRAVCTSCSFERNLDTDFGRAVSCPNCGAKMDMEAEK